MTTNFVATKSPYPKCERCWNHPPSCAYNTYFEDNLCKRCVDILCNLEERGLWLKCPACLDWFFDKIEGDPENINDNYICPECLGELENKNGH